MFKMFFRFLIYTLGIFIFGLVLFTVTAGQDESGVLTTIALIGSLVALFSPIIAIIVIWRQKKRESSQSLVANKANDEQRKNALRHRFLERQRLVDSIDRHRTALSRNIERSVSKNDYGSIVKDGRNDALEEFFASIDLDVQAVGFEESVDVVFEQLGIRDEEDRAIGFDAQNLPFDGHAFEKWVAEALNGFGWEAEVTRGSGDQGIDVIAKKDGKKLGLQCKLYSSSIGNKAVQEAHAGKAFYNADEVGVLSNAPYTASAKELALVTGVHLLSHHDIPKLFDKITAK